MKIQNNYNPDVLSCLANLSNDEVFTPPKLANEILDLLPKELWSDKSATFLDPVCKSGVFLREIAKRLIEGLKDEIPDIQKRTEHIFNKQLFGIGITELTSLLSRRSLYCSMAADGKYSIVNSFSSNKGNVFFDSNNHEWKKGKCFFCGASQSEYERDDGLESHAYQFIHDNTPNVITNMKFDVIIGNPPYQLNDGGAGSSAKPIYNLFIEQAKKLNPRYLTMIIPSRWFAGGKGLDNFRDTMLHDKRFVTIVDYPNPKDCFPSNNISGGVCYYLWDREYHGDCNFINIIGDKKISATRKLDEFDIFVRYNDALSIIKKVTSIKEDFLSTIISSRKPFGLNSYDRGNNKKGKNDLLLHSSAGIGYIDKKDVKQGIELINKYNVIIGKALSGHIGETDQNGQVKVLATIKLIKPNEVCTESYLCVGAYENSKIAKNLKQYLETKFARFLLLQSLTSMNITKDRFIFVPLQDFSKSWTDENLYKKYKLTNEEIKFIESMIRPIK
jgi:adenine-specific DNA methylase